MDASRDHAADLPECPGAQGGGLLPEELRAWMTVLAATGAAERRLHSVVKERLDVSHDEFLVLCLLAEEPEGGLRMSRVAELLGRPKTRLTYQIACLQHSGLVARRSVRGDRRGVEVSLTDRARRLLTEASDALAEAVTDALARFVGPAQRAALRALLPETADGSRPGRAAPGGAPLPAEP
ncbi:MarR family winged helix-turn-helix transcriptional regulator [Streptomyces sp. NPDC050560]|uniref:MarR family winged helix-turn-helix transcriptional regulator n=1 Tax=Streptomyces sp. NPDC050560 TaxID=3365630 RepID=UPI0037ADE1C7